ncbi:MAG: M50 family metallopeptidase, partial [Candidatus Omnitrophica bacterium]|nr:M50 family metallopeptidase [Candidatus Omnitrophota bacterium]
PGRLPRRRRKATVDEDKKVGMADELPPAPGPAMKQGTGEVDPEEAEGRLSQIIELEDGKIKTTSAVILSLKVGRVLIWASRIILLAASAGAAYFIFNMDPFSQKVAITGLTVGVAWFMLTLKKQKMLLRSMARHAPGVPEEKKGQSPKARSLKFKPFTAYLLLLASICLNVYLISFLRTLSIHEDSSNVILITGTLAVSVSFFINMLTHEAGHALTAQILSKTLRTRIKFAFHRLGLMFLPSVSLEGGYWKVPEWKFKVLTFGGPLASFILFTTVCVFCAVNPLTVFALDFPLMFLVLVSGVSVFNLLPMTSGSDGSKIAHPALRAFAGEGIKEETLTEIREYLRSKSIAVELIIERGNENSAKIDKNGRLYVLIKGKGNNNIKEVKRRIDILFGVDSQNRERDEQGTREGEARDTSDDSGPGTNSGEVSDGAAPAMKQGTGEADPTPPLKISSKSLTGQATRDDNAGTASRRKARFFIPYIVIFAESIILMIITVIYAIERVSLKRHLYPFEYNGVLAGVGLISLFACGLILYFMYKDKRTYKKHTPGTVMKRDTGEVDPTTPLKISSKSLTGQATHDDNVGAASRRKARFFSPFIVSLAAGIALMYITLIGAIEGVWYLRWWFWSQPIAIKYFPIRYYGLLAGGGLLSFFACGLSGYFMYKDKRVYKNNIIGFITGIILMIITVIAPFMGPPLNWWDWIKPTPIGGNPLNSWVWYYDLLAGAGLISFLLCGLSGYFIYKDKRTYKKHTDKPRTTPPGRLPRRRRKATVDEDKKVGMADELPPAPGPAMKQGTGEVDPTTPLKLSSKALTGQAHDETTETLDLDTVSAEYKAALDGLVEAMIWAGSKDEKVVLAFDYDLGLGEGELNRQVALLIRKLEDISENNPQLKALLKNLTPCTGRGRDLAERLTDITGEGRKRKPENVIVITSEKNTALFDGFRTVAGIKVTDEKGNALPDDAYYKFPLPQVALLAVGKYLGWSDERLAECYQDIFYAVSLDELQESDADVYRDLFAAGGRIAVKLRIPDALRMTEEAEFKNMMALVLEIADKA